jgi:Tol biopolymer transport system component
LPHHPRALENIAKMRLSIASLVSLAAGAAMASCQYSGAQARRECPYAAKLARDTHGAHGDHDGKPGKHPAAPGKLGVMYMNRIGPSGSQLYIANADGTNAKPLMGNQKAPFDYHANWSPDGKWIVFTSERRADGQSDLYRVRPDGTGLETLVSTNSFEDAGVLSPNGKQLAYISTAFNYTANLYVLDIAKKHSTRLTGDADTVGNLGSPHSFFRPAWSPDGKYIAFSSDINTDWTGHSNGTGWEHTQELSIYMIKPDGTGFRQVIADAGNSLGTPKWSPDGRRIIYNNMTTEATYGAHGIAGSVNNTVSQLFDVDVATGLDVVQLTDGPNIKISAQYLGGSNIGYLIKGGDNEGVHYTAPDAKHANFARALRNPSWSPDGSRVVYEVADWTQRQAEQELFSWDGDYEYRFMDVFPQLNTATGKLATTQKQLGRGYSDALVTDANYTNPVTAFDVVKVNDTDAALALYKQGTSGAFQPTWNSDGSQIAVGFGSWFVHRTTYPGTVYLASADGSSFRNLTDGTLNAGFPSFSPDGKQLVFRIWDGANGPLGLHLIDLATGSITRLTHGWDNMPGWSPDGERIVFTRQTNWTEADGPRWQSDRFDVATIRPDGTGLAILTDSDASDAHAVWAPDGRIMYTSGMYGFREESALYDNTFQPYGQLIVMNADGSNKTMLTDSMWEDSMPQYVANEFLG